MPTKKRNSRALVGEDSFFQFSLQITPEGWAPTRNVPLGDDQRVTWRYRESIGDGNRRLVRQQDARVIQVAECAP